MTERIEADYVIVSAGYVGCVLANRLSADSNTGVVLLEMGGDGREQEPLAVHFERKRSMIVRPQGRSRHSAELSQRIQGPGGCGRVAAIGAQSCRSACISALHRPRDHSGTRLCFGRSAVGLCPKSTVYRLPSGEDVCDGKPRLEHARLPTACAGG